MSTYGSLLRTPGVARIIAAQLTARLPNGMLSLAYLLRVQYVTHSYGEAGLVLAATSVGQAIAGPLTSRWMGRWGMRPVLILTTLVCAATIFSIAFITLTLPMYVVIGFIGGLSTPPVQPAVRTIYPKMVTSSQLTRLFALDASAQEIIWIAGPVVITFVSIQVSTVIGVLIPGVLLLGGGLWFLLSPEVGKVRIPRSRRSLGAVLRKKPVILATLVGLLLIGACAATEADVVSVFGHRGPQAGIVLAVWSIGSLIGGLALGSQQLDRWALSRRMVVIAIGIGLATVAVALQFGGTFWTLTGALLVAGLGIAPALGVMSAIVASSVRFSETAEAYGWVGTGQLIGAAAGSAVAGFFIDGHGAIGGFIVASVLAVLAALVAIAFHGWHPDLRGRDSSPIPDTEPVGVPRG
ncbi:MAG TPA: MFS transporter [Galbitalea sp.]|nr:MFS transporter [Galbitalea sp.]